MDNKGYVMGGMAFLLIIPSLILANIFISTVMMDKTQITPIKSDKLQQLSEDVGSDISIFSLQALNETCDMASKTGEPISNSRSNIKTKIQTKIDGTYSNYQNETGITVSCKINSIDNSKDPYKININATLYANYNDSYMAKDISRDVQFANSNYPDSSFLSCNIKDPLPFIKTKGYGNLKTDGDKIYYGTALSEYLRSKGISNFDVYENASSPLYIKKCPYDPYLAHGHSNLFLTLKNCIDNGYYHVSASGPCIFCRMEGKSVCSHTGLETFVAPGNKLTYDRAPCSVDHVIFGANSAEIYTGKSLALHFNNTPLFFVYLDNGHRTKYGLPTE